MLLSYEQVLQQNKLYYARQKLKGRTQLKPEAYSRTEIPELVSKYEGYMQIYRRKQGQS